MTTMFVLVRICIWVLGFYKLRLLERSWAPLSFALRVVGEVIVLLSLFVCLMHP